jgi:hypothetical protein
MLRRPKHSKNEVVAPKEEKRVHEDHGHVTPYGFISGH